MQGLYYEECEIGRVIEHTLRRTVTEADNTFFSCMTHNPQPLHIDHDYAAKTEFGKPLVNSLFTLSLMIGVSVGDTTLGTLVANLGMTDCRFSNPVFHGDTLRFTTEIVSRRESQKRPNAGIVEFLHRAYKQDGRQVAECKRQTLMQKRS